MLTSTATTILVPKNRGLLAQATHALDLRGVSKEHRALVRGEDVGQLASDAARCGRDIVAITGDDLLDNWLAAGNTLDARLGRERVAWNDPSAMFGKPALCLIAAPQTQLDGGRVRIAVCARYAALAEPMLRALESTTTVVRSYVQGALEVVLAAGMADAIVDIVLTGKSIASYGLVVREVLYRSDLAVLVSA